VILDPPPPHKWDGEGQEVTANKNDTEKKALVREIKKKR